LNATRAYRAAYPRCTNNTTASVNGWKLLRIAKVQARIAQLATKAAANIGLSLERTLLEAARLAFSDIRKLFHEDGSLKAPHELDADTAAALVCADVKQILGGKSGARQTVRQRTRVKMVDKNPALERLMKHFDLYKDRQRTERRPDSRVTGRYCHGERRASLGPGQAAESSSSPTRAQDTQALARWILFERSVAGNGRF